MVIKPFKLFLLISFLFTFILSQKYVEIDFDGYYYEYFQESTTLQITFEPSDYIHIEISFDDKSPIVSMSKTDSKCKENRKLLGMQTYSPINLFFRQPELPNSQEYLCIQCQNNQKCNYHIIIEKAEKCKLSFGQQFSYLVDEKNTKMEFEFVDKNNVNLRRLASIDSKLNFWVKGQNQLDVQEIFPSTAKKVEFDFGYTFSTEYKSGQSYILRVSAEEGDYVTVGSIGIDDNISKILRINDLEIMGILDSEQKEICFPIEKVNSNSLLSIKGNIFTKRGEIYYKRKGEIEEDTHKIIENGLIEALYFDSQAAPDNDFCIRALDEYTNNFEIVFTLQLTSNKDDNLNRFIYSPLLPGVIYSHFLLKGEMAVFQAMKPKDGATEINFNMKALKGFPDMAFDECKDFPNCVYHPESLETSENPHHSNRMTVYSFYLDNNQKKEFTPLTPFQPLLIVNCIEGTNDEVHASDYCLFETSIFTNKDRLNLIEGETFSQYLLSGESDLYTINIKDQENLQKVYVDLIIFSGDVDFNIENGLESHKYFISNKIFFSIHVGSTDKKVDFTVTAYKNSFYMVQYQLVKDQGLTGDRNIIESGVNYIQSIIVGDNADFFKEFTFQNFKYASRTPYLASFYSQNCKFVVSRILRESGDIDTITLYDSYGQIIIDEGDPDFEYDKYTFRLDITSDDVSNYEGKLCMLYITGLELSNTTTGSERYISVSDGVPQYFIFSKKYAYMKYSYHVSDQKSALIINFNLIDKAPYLVEVLFGYKPFIGRKIYRNEQIILYASQLQENCPEVDEVCTVNVNIELENKEDERERKLETTIYQYNGAPTFLEKNAEKQDILLGNEKKYYYLDIGQGEMGDITIDYKRGSGYIYAKVEPKVNMAFDPEADWRGMYKFPSHQNDSLRYETYLKKIIITPEDTKECEFGCYLLITVINTFFREYSAFDEKIAFLPYRISIIPRIYTEDYVEEKSKPRVKIKVNDFIIGNLYQTYDKIFEFYSVTLPYESEFVYIDWQADKSSLYINVGDERPTLESSDFKFESTGYDTIFSLRKEDILKKLGSDADTLRNVELTLGIWTEKLDTLYTSVYAFKIFMPPSFKGGLVPEAFEIYHVRTDQKVQCEPYEIFDYRYMCVFAVIFDDADVNGTLVVYPKAQKETVSIEFKGALVDSEQIERNNLPYILDQIENLKVEFTSENGDKYMYVNKIVKNKCLLFFAYAEEKTNIEVLSSTYLLFENLIFSPNPSTPQIFALGDQSLNFLFETTKDLLINIVSIAGEGYFYWGTEQEDNNLYHLSRYADRLTLTSGTQIVDNKLTFLTAKPFITDEEKKKGGFIFYMTFYPRNGEENVDQVKVGRSTEFVYRDLKFPLNYFTRLEDKDVSISFTFYNFHLNRNEIMYEKPLFNLWGKIIKEDDAFNSRYDKRFWPENDSNSIKGSIDGPFATLLLTAKDIQKFKIYEEYNPNLFFSLELNDETLFTKFNEIDIEVSILKEQSQNETELFATKNVYYNGRLTNDRTISSPKYIYKLQVDHSNPYMRIEFSSNSDLVHWVVTIDRNSKKDYEEFIDLSKRYINGRYLMTFKIPETVKNSLYLIVFNDDKTTVDPRLTNFVFKYIDSNDKDSFFEFPVENDSIQCTKNEKNGLKSYTITFSPIEQYDVTYYIKGIYAKSKIEGEWMNSIAISESESYNLQLDNPKYEGEDKLSVTLDDIKEEISDIKIMAQIELTSLREFVLYEPLAVKDDDTPVIPIEGDEIPPSRNLIPINIKTSEECYTGNANNAYKIQKYKLNFDDKSKISDYLSIGIVSFDSVDNNKIMYISTSDENGKKDRIQLVQSGIEKFAYIFVKKEQIVNNLFIVVECQINDEERCNYSLSVVKYDYINSVLMFNKNIYITEKNKIMNFKLIYLKEETAPILSVYVNSGKPLNLILTDKSGKKYDFDKFKNGAAITIKTNEREFDVEVHAEEGDYISFGDKLIEENGKSDLNILKPYQNPITGFLKRGILENECYSIDDESPSYIVGVFYNQIAEISFKDENYKDISNSKELIKKGYYTYLHGNESKNIKYICVGMPNTNEYNLDYLAYSLQITKSESQNVIPTPPLLSGNIHPKILKRGTYAYFSVGYLNSNYDEIVYNMIATEGSPKMYIYKCTNYPLCEINFKNNQNLISINELNRMSLWLNKEKILSPIDPEQYVMVVKCEEFGRSDSDVCQFQVSMYGNKDDVNLIEGQQFSQYLLKGKNSRFAIDFSGDKSVTKVFIDIFVISGDVDINLKNEDGKTEMKSLKYYLSNKIFYSVSKTDNSNFKNIFVNIDAKVNSYYIIEYKLIRESANEDTYDIYDGINYLIPIQNEGNGKKINIHNLKLLYDDFYLANFYSLNCDIKVNRINQNGKEEAILSSFVNSGEDIISRENTKVIDYHSYSVSIVEPDSSQYNNNLCMLYVSGLEITQNPLAQKEILLSEGIPHKAVFEQPLSKIKYVYPNPDRTKNIAVHFKVINPANYTMSLIFNSGKKEQKYFYQSNIEYVEYSDINNNCTESNLCSITILLEVTNKIENYVPTLEVSIRQIDNIPFYFSKGVLRHDFVAADSWTNLYTIVGKNDEGYINVDFARGSGLIYAKVLPINGAAESNPEWRQYKFPREQKGTLKYDFYDKKILFKKEDTANCDEGCYLLISLQPSAVGKFDEQFRFFEFAMTVSIIPDKELKKNGPIIKIEPEEYVIGSLTNSEKIKNKDMYEFYQLYIPFDAEKIEFDWQSDSAKLLLNVGENRPTMDSALIKKESRSDTIFEISRSDLKLTGKNIANTLLTIGVYTENMESEFGTPYSFRVHFAKTLDIYKVTSDHKTLCKPSKTGEDDEYRCLFMIIYNELDFLYDVMAYAKSQNPSALLYMVGNFIDKDIYDQLDMDKLDELIPDGETAAYNTAADNLDFIFLTLSDYESHFYISVLTNKPEPIEFITSFKTFDTELSPNPSSTQLFSINNNPSMKLKFKTTKPIFINFVCLYGSSKIYLEDEKNTVYHLRDRDDRLSLAIPPNTGKETILIVENLKYDASDISPPDDNEDETIEKPGVAFYLDYNLRSLDKNLDEISLGNTAEIAYKQSDFPVYYYSKLDELNNDINVFFNLHDLELTDKKLEERVIKTEEFVFKGSVIPQNTIYELKTDKNAKVNNEKSVIGKYDPALQTGQIYLTTENLKTNAENPTLYLSFEKQEKINVNYKSIRLELTVVEKNRDNPVTEKLYQYGTILNKDDINSYKLKVDNKTGEFRIQFAANSKNVNFAINNEKGKKENSTLSDLKTKTERGKLFLTFKKPSLDFIYLNVFLNDKVSNQDKRLNNYVFKYVNARNISNLAEYPILNNNAAIEGTMTKDKKSVEVKFNRINKDNIDVVYTLKYAKKSELSKEEIGSTIAISESPSYVTQVHNPKGDKITLKMNNIDGEYAYVEVFALIKDGPVVEYVAYEPNKSLKITDKSSETNSDDDENNNKTLIIVISCVGGGVLLLLIILIVIVVLYNSKTKDLLENVNKISFADGDDKKDKNENLLLDNELK